MSDVSVLSDEDRTRLWQVMNRMPHGAGLQARPFTMDGLTVDRLVGMLDELVGRLEEHAASDAERYLELAEAQNVINAGRTLFAALAGPKPDSPE